MPGVRYGVDQWLVKWIGYDEAHNTWEPWEHLGLEVQAEAYGGAPHQGGLAAT